MILLNRVSRAISILAEPYEISPSRVTLAEEGGRGTITDIPYVCLAEVHLGQANRGARDIRVRADVHWMLSILAEVGQIFALTVRCVTKHTPVLIQ